MSIKHLREGRGRIWILLLSLLGLVLIAYANSFRAGLTLDSALLIGLDPRITAWSGEHLKAIVGESYWGAFARSDLYRPVTTFTYLINYAVLGNGDRVVGYHAVNVLLHAANVLLGFAVLRKLGSTAAVAALAAGLFAVHPVNVEAVTNLVGRADLLALLTVLGAGMCYVRAWEVQRGARVGWLIAAGEIAAVGAFAKENAIMAVGFAVLYDLCWRWPKQKAEGTNLRLGQALLEFGWKGWSVFAPAIGLLLAARFALGLALTPAGYAFVDNPILYAGTIQGVMTALGVIGRYLMLLVFPASLSCDYSYAQIPLFGEASSRWQDLVCVLSLVAVGTLGCLAWRYRRSQPLVTWGIAYFFLMLLPVSNLLLRIGSIMGERFLYLPSLGLCAVFAVALQAAGEFAAARLNFGQGSRLSLVRLFLPTLVLVSLVTRTHARNRDWLNELSLWKSAVNAVPASFKAHLGLASATWETDKSEASLDAALGHAEKAREILERVTLPPERMPQTVHAQLGMFYRYKGELLQARQPAEAAAFFRRAIDALEKARSVDRRENEALRQRLIAVQHGTFLVPQTGNPRLCLDLSVAHMHLSNWPALETAAHDLQRFAPSEASGYAFQAVAETNQQRDDEAAVHFLAALILDRNDAQVRAHLAARYDRLGVRPSPVGPTAASGLVDPADPRVRRHVNAAFALLVANHANAGKAREADAIRALAITQFQVPAERFSNAPVGRPATAPQ